MNRNDTFIRKPNRLQGYDYSRAGYYFITVCTKGKKNLFWEAPAGGNPDVAAACGRHPLSKTGRCAASGIERLSHIYDGISVDKYVIMPNHIHMILRIHSAEGWRPQAAATVGHVINQFKGAVSKEAGFPVWQKSYYDHIIRDSADYRRVWDYIDANPARLREDHECAEPTGETL